MAASVTEGLEQWTAAASSWTSSVFSSRRVQIAATAVISGSVVAGLILGYQNVNRDRRLRDLKDSLDIPEAEQDPVAKLIDQTLRNRSLPSTHPSSTSYSLIPSPDSSNHASTPPPPSKEDVRASALAARARRGDYDDELINEQLTRTSSFLTPAGLSKIRSAFVIIVGCGGVGSHAAAALVRSGISKVRLIDFDQVTLSSLNRHAVATLADVGTPKVRCLQRRLEQIAPWCEFDLRNELLGASIADIQLQPWQAPTQDGQDGGAQAPDFVVDAIDNIDSKVELLAYCHRNNLKVISSMGAGCKSDPTRVFVTDLSQSTDDPLSKSTRRRLRMQGIASGIPVVYSSEKTAPGKATLLPLAEEEFQKGRVNELGVLPDFRVRILPVLGTMPATFGLCVANHILLEISGYPHEYLQAKSRDKMYDGILAALQGSEEKLVRWAGEDAIGLRIPVSTDDIGYLVEEVYHGKSVVSGIASRLALVRWTWPDVVRITGDQKKIVLDCEVEGQKTVFLPLNDLVCMTKDEAAKHENEVLKGGKTVEEVWGQETVQKVLARQEEEKAYSRYR